MRFRISFKGYLVVLLLTALSPSAFSASVTKTISQPSVADLLTKGNPTLNSNVLSVGMPGVELIPAAESESRAVAQMTKGLAIPEAGLLKGLKSGMKLNAASLIGGLAFDQLIKGIGWIEGEGGVITKPGSTGTSVATSSGEYQWGGATAFFSSADDACTDMATYKLQNNGGPKLTDKSVTMTSSSSAVCSWSYTYSTGVTGSDQYNLSRVGNGCPANSSYSSTTGACVTASTATTPVTDSDMSVLDGFVLGKDGVWQQGLANEVCKSSGNYDTCVANMGATPYVTGPASVSSPTVTTTTTSTNPDGTSSVTTTNTTTNYALSYSSTGTSVTITPTTSTTTSVATKDATGTTTGTTTAAIPRRPHLLTLRRSLTAVTMTRRFRQ